MNSKQRKIWSSIFTNPIPRNLTWNDLLFLLKNIGCDVIEGDGSRVGFEYKGRRLDLHRPHPGKEIKPYQVKAVREFLKVLEVKP